jgi:hypothetical protein
MNFKEEVDLHFKEGADNLELVLLLLSGVGQRQLHLHKSVIVQLVSYENFNYYDKLLKEFFFHKPVFLAKFS